MDRRVHDRASGESEEPRPEVAAPHHGLPAAVAALQRSAGNRAVGALLARAPSEDRGEAERSGGGARVTLGSLGVIPIESIQLPVRPPVDRTGSGGRGGEKPPGGELSVTSRSGRHSLALQRASSEGRAMDGRVDFADPGLRLELTNAVVTELRVSAAHDGHAESWTLDVGSIRFVRLEPDRDAG